MLAIQQPDLFDVSLLGDGGELLLPESEQRHRFTGDVVAQNQARYVAIVKAIGEGWTMRKIEEWFRVSHHTVLAIRRRDPQLVATEKERFARKLNQARELAADQLVDALEDNKIAAGQLPVALGILTDKSLALAGEPNVRVSVRRELSVDELRRAFQTMAGVSPDSQSAVITVDCEQIGQVSTLSATNGVDPEPPTVDSEPTTTDETAPKKGGEGVANSAGGSGEGMGCPPEILSLKAHA